VRTSEYDPYTQYESPLLQGFEATCSLLRPLAAARVYQAALRQGSKRGVGVVLSALWAVGIIRGWMLMQVPEFYLRQ
jgi:hypothetical protein